MSAMLPVAFVRPWTSAKKNFETYNLGTGIGASNLDVIALLRPLAVAAGHTIQVRHLPSRRFDVEANVLDARKLCSVC